MDDTATPDPTVPPDPQQVQATLLHLRERADQRRRLVTEAAEPRTPGEVQRLVLELQTHQIELEMQYEELLLAQAEADNLRQRYADLYDYAPVGYLSLRPDDTIAQLNLCAAQLLGEPRQRLEHRRFLLFVAPAHRDRFRAFLAQVLAGSHPRRTELELLRADGHLFFAELQGLARPDPQGRPQCQLVVTEVDERRRAADVLAASEARFRATFEQSTDGMLLLEDHHFVDANQAAARLLGLPDPAALRGRHLARFWPEFQPSGRRSMTVLSECMNRATAQGWCRLEWMRHNAAGEEVWDEMSFNPVVVQGQPLLHCIWRDITQQRRAREALRTSEERQQLALRAAEAGVWAVDFEAGRVDCDERAAALFGHPAAPLTLRLAEFMAAIHPDDRAGVYDALQHAIEQRQPLQVAHRIVWPDGTVRHVAGAGLLSYTPQGQPQRLTGLLRDVTAPHEAAQLLRQEKEFTSRLLENSVDGIAAVDAAGRLTAWNARIVAYTGRPAAEALGRPVLEVLPHFGTPAHRTTFQRVMAGESVTLLSQPFTFREGRYDAYLVPLREGAGAAAEAPVSGVLCIIRDVTERDRLAEEATQLRLARQKEVLAAVLDTQESERKRIAEALHNGLGQLLYATKLNLEGQRTPAAEAAQQLLREAIVATRSISFELTPGILEDFGLRAALEEIVKRIAPRQLRVRLHLAGLDQRLPAPVEIAVYRITQELLNNVMKHAQASEAHIYVVREGPRLELTVEDNGRGFDAARFNSEPLGGIGLTGVRNRVQLLGGTLDIASRPGKGTIVSIELAV